MEKLAKMWDWLVYERISNYEELELITYLNGYNMKTLVKGN